MKFHLDHIGWITNHVEKFEYFWVEGLGFEKIWEANIMPAKVKQLFGIEKATRAMRYKKDDMIIEIHVFDPPLAEVYNPFERFGMNHIGIWVENREEFIRELREKLGYLEEHRFHDPSGWDNIFIRDYDGNWVEVRTTL